MPQQAQLTDKDMAVYRPWVWIRMKNPAGGDILINYPDGPDQKFRWLKDFRLTWGSGQAVQFTIFEDRDQYTLFWLQSVMKNIAEANKYIVFQFGYSGRDVNGERIAPIPETYGAHASKLHALLIKNVEIEYAEGGTNYKFTCADPLSNLADYNAWDKVGPCSFRQAIQTVLSKAEQEGKLPAGYSRNTVYTKEFLEDYEIDKPQRTWNASGFPYLLTIQKWTQFLESKKNAQKKDYDMVAVRVYPNSEANAQGAVFDVWRVNTAQPVIEIHVNPPDKGPLGVGKHTALSIRPNIPAANAWTFMPQISCLDTQSFRTITFNNKQGPIFNTEQGLPTELTACSPDDPLTTAQNKVTTNASRVGGASMFAFASIDTELLGNPIMDGIEWMSVYNKVSLVVWNNAFIDTDLKWRREARMAIGQDASGQDTWIMGSINPNFSGTYYITDTTHYINSEGSYTTTLKLNPIGGMDQFIQGKFGR